jgi:integrase
MTRNIPLRANTLREGVSNGKKRGRPRKTVGRKREGTSLGRYPFVNVIGKYLEKRRGIVARSTFFEEERKLKYLAKVLQNLKAEGKIDSTNPEKIGRKDIQGFMGWMRDSELDPETQAKYLQHLNNLLLFCGNPIIENLKREGIRFPSSRGKSIRSIGENGLRRIRNAAEELEGWDGEISRLIVWFLPATGLRPKELRLAHFEDLDTQNWEFYVRHPKGEGSWGERRTVIVLPEARPAVIRFLKAREEHLISKGIKKATPLVPNLYYREPGFYSSNHLRKLKKNIQEISGAEFRIKDFRPTFAQRIIDRDPSLLPDVSSVLGHSNIATTQKYYAQIRRGTALHRIETAWIGFQAQENKNNLIEREKLLSGFNVSGPGEI